MRPLVGLNLSVSIKYAFCLVHL